MSDDLERRKPQPIPANSKDRRADSDRRLVGLRVTTEEYSGDWPHPAHLKAYQEISPAFVEMIAKEVALDGQHRRDMDRVEHENETLALKADIRADRRGTYAALTAIVVISTAGVTFAALGHPTQGAGFMGTLILGVAGAFINSRIQARKEREAVSRQEPAPSSTEEKPVERRG